MTLKLKDTSFINIKFLFQQKIDINKILLSNTFPFGEQDFK